ncbi:hypothetical protein PROFUN_03660 [Planoprotostelium fungivorum]|uniref:C2 domain-containing protein n=1 Tax=Planoprotostelium fungivorum TaxID=1890364 RepID=A0A2P6NSG6_9EUKA|nr:hypothetical protein PROFUN_03660 [Planoprotostelium fungivorum]
MRLLVVEVLEARGIFHQDGVEALEPIVRLSYGRQKHTSAMSVGAHPIWRFTATFDITASSKLQGRIYDGASETAIALGGFTIDEIELGLNQSSGDKQISDRWHNLDVPFHLNKNISTSIDRTLPQIHIRLTQIQDENEENDSEIEPRSPIARPSTKDVNRMYVMSRNDIAYIFCCFVVVVLPICMGTLSFTKRLIRWENRLTSGLFLLISIWVIWNNYVDDAILLGICAWTFQRYVWNENHSRRSFRESIVLGVTRRDEILSRAHNLLDQYGLSHSSSILQGVTLNPPCWISSGLRHQVKISSGNNSTLVSHLLLVSPFLSLIISTMRKYQLVHVGEWTWGPNMVCLVSNCYDVSFCANGIYLLFTFLTQPVIYLALLRPIYLYYPAFHERYSLSKVDNQGETPTDNRSVATSSDMIAICGNMLFCSGGLLKSFKKKFLVVDHNRMMYIFDTTYSSKQVQSHLGGEKMFAKTLMATHKVRIKIDLSR